MRRQDTERLWRAIREGLAPEGDFTLSTERSITRIEAQDFDSLMAAVAESSEPGNPEVLDNLWMVARDRFEIGQPTREVRVLISERRDVTCMVQGDPTWVRGRAATLKPLIEDFRPFKWEIWYIPRFSYVALGSAAGSSVYTIGNLVIPKDTFSPTSDAAFLIAAILLGMTVFGLAGNVITKKSKTQIWPKHDEIPRGWMHLNAGEVLSVMIAILAIMATIIFGTIAHSDTKKNGGSSSAEVP